MDQTERLRALCPGAVIRTGVPLDKYTTLRVGGPADFFCEPESADELSRLLSAAEEMEMPVLLMGNGSNLLIRDGGFRGLVLHMGKGLSRIERTDGGLRAGAGALLSTLARAAQEHHLTGLEFAQGIPGSVGGGLYMNAGAYGGELGKVVSSVRVLDNGKERTLNADEMGFAYRHTRAMEENWVILEADFRLEEGNPGEIAAAMQDFASRRREKQPLEYPSAGSFFKRPPGHFAGALIEQSGLKGYAVGGAQVSEKHAGFLINRGGATAADFLRLTEYVQDTVEKRFGVRLEPEVRIVGSEK